MACCRGAENCSGLRTRPLLENDGDAVSPETHALHLFVTRETHTRDRRENTPSVVCETATANFVNDSSMHADAILNAAAGGWGRATSRTRLGVGERGKRRQHRNRTGEGKSQASETGRTHVAAKSQLPNALALVIVPEHALRFSRPRGKLISEVRLVLPPNTLVSKLCRDRHDISYRTEARRAAYLRWWKPWVVGTHKSDDVASIEHLDDRKAAFFKVSPDLRSRGRSSERLEERRTAHT